MSKYTDGFIIPVPTDNLAAYREMAGKAGALWREYGALDFKECVLDDEKSEMCQPFTSGIKVHQGETIVFSWILFESREHRDSVNAKVMADPRMKEICPGATDPAPFDVTRMLYSGFEVIVDA